MIRLHERETLRSNGLPISRRERTTRTAKMPTISRAAVGCMGVLACCSLDGIGVRFIAALCLSFAHLGVEVQNLLCTLLGCAIYTGSFGETLYTLPGSFGQKWAATPISAAVLRAKWGARLKKRPTNLPIKIRES